MLVQVVHIRLLFSPKTRDSRHVPSKLLTQEFTQRRSVHIPEDFNFQRYTFISEVFFQLKSVCFKHFPHESQISQKKKLSQTYATAFAFKEL